jgi:hypothetical protein
VRLFELPRSLSPARVLPQTRLLPDEAAVLEALAGPAEAGLDPEKVAIAEQGHAGALDLADAGGAASLARSARGRLELHAEGPGVLVVATSWDPGWQASVDGVPAPVWRVQHSRIGVPLEPGAHRVRLEHSPRGLGVGLLLFGLGATGAIVGLVRGGWPRRSGSI